MSSFLNRLKKKNVIPSTPDDEKETKLETQNAPKPTHEAVAEQLKVDIFQTQTEIIVYAQIAGASEHDCDITIEGDDDVVIIKGERRRPNGEHFNHHPEENQEHVLGECVWGKFYREIILPAEIDASRAEAKMKEGVLMLLLPLQKSVTSGVRIDVLPV